MAAVLDVTSRCIRIIKKPMWRCLAAISLVVAVAHIVGHCFVQALLRAVTRLPSHRLQSGDPGFEKGLAFGVDRCALLGADHKGANPVPVDAAFVRKRIPVQQLHQAA